jgi:UDP-glucose 4-epimerase
MFLAAAGQKLTVNGSGEQVRAYIHVHDTTDCLEALLDAELDGNVYDLVSRNLSVQQIIEGVTTVFPDSEQLYINQHVEPWELRVRPDERIGRFRSQKDRTFLDEIREFKKEFTLNFHD